MFQSTLFLLLVFSLNVCLIVCQQQCRTLFVTSRQVPNGALGAPPNSDPLLYADGLCTLLARQSTLSSKNDEWRAFISTSRLSVVQRATISPTDCFIDSKRRVVASSRDELFSSATWLEFDENGVSRGGVTSNAWTGTKANGGPSSDTCNDWTIGNSSSLGTRGWFMFDCN
jgi:hypothetical protein